MEGCQPTSFAIGSDLIPVDIECQYHVDIWMTYHPDARSISRVSFFIDWLRTLFDPKRYPWFGDEFIHPRDLAQNQPPPKMKRALLRLRFSSVAAHREPGNPALGPPKYPHYLNTFP